MTIAMTTDTTWASLTARHLARAAAEVQPRHSTVSGSSWSAARSRRVTVDCWPVAPDSDPYTGRVRRTRAWLIRHTEHSRWQGEGSTVTWSIRREPLLRAGGWGEWDTTTHARSPVLRDVPLVMIEPDDIRDLIAVSEWSD